MCRTGSATSTTDFQKSLDTGELPLDWQKANASPIFKTVNRSDPGNYRPVSLTSIPCKMSEHTIHTNIMRHLEKYKVLNDERHGFCRGQSCETKIALSVNDLAKVLYRQSQADVVIMDLSKIFDLVPHQRLLSKLCHFGITGKLHNWIQIFLTMRTQQVVLEGVSSSSITVTSGVPQGTVLGPIHFILYLNDLPEGISSQVRLLADDCILCQEINAINDCQDIQKDTNTLCTWVTKWQMKFNIDKCYIMHVTHKRNPLLMTYKMNGRPTEVKASHTYLGIGINNKLSWAEHISNTASKANMVLGLLCRNLYCCSPFVKETAYKSLDRLKLEYCSSILDPYHQEHKNKLESVQCRATRTQVLLYRHYCTISRPWILHHCLNTVLLKNHNP